MKNAGKFLVVAIVFSFVAASMARLWLKQREEQLEAKFAPPSVAKTSVIVPQTFIPAGAFIGKQNLSARSIPSEYVPPNVLQVSDFKSIDGRQTIVDLQPGKVIPWTAILGERQADFADEIKLGKRAKTIRVSAIESFDGMLRPGNAIDLLGSFSANQLPDATATDQGAGRRVLVPVLENVFVMATGRMSAEDSTSDVTARRAGLDASYSTVTVQVTPRDAARLTMAQELGDLTAVLRNSDDASVSGFDVFRGSEIFRINTKNPTEVAYDARGNYIGRRVGNKVIDNAGRTVARIQGDHIVSKGGHDLGKALLMPADAAGQEVALDAQGKVIGVRRGNVVYDGKGEVAARIVDGKVLDQAGRVLNDKVQTRRLGDSEEILKSADGTVIGTRRGDQVVNADGRIVGRVVTDPSSGQDKIVDSRGNALVMGADGQIVGHRDGDKLIGKDGQVIGRMQATSASSAGQAVDPQGSEVVLASDGTVVGSRVGDNVVDSDGKVVGHLVKDSNTGQENVVGSSGALIAANVSRASSSAGKHGATPGSRSAARDGSIIGGRSGDAAQTVVDDKGRPVLMSADGHVVGARVGNNVVDQNGKIIGQVTKDPATGNENVVDQAGHVIARDVSSTVSGTGVELSQRAVEQAENDGDLVMDSNGRALGVKIGNTVVDRTGKPIATISDGKVVANDGTVLADSVVTADPGQARQSASYFEFIAGGVSKQGVAEVRKIVLRKEENVQ